jgi:hypothetical protein
MVSAKRADVQLLFGLLAIDHLAATGAFDPQPLGDASFGTAISIF